VKRHALMALLMPLISTASAFSLAADKSHVAVPAMMGNAKMGLLCAQAPEFASRDCQTTVIPDNGRTRALFPYIPEQYNLLYRDEDSRLFSQFSGYPFVVKHQDGVCSLENAAVITRKNTVDYPVYNYTCDGAAQESADLSRVQVNYIGAGVFQTENDAHFYGGITMDILHKEFAAMYPNTTVPCDSEAEYCLEQLNVVVNGSSEPYSSAWKDGRVLLGRGIIGNGGFSHATSLDIIAHETGHALLTWNSTIGYENNDTAAIQEAFADLTAVLVRNEFYKKLQAGGEQNFIESDAHQQLSTDGNFYYAMAWDKYVQNRALRYLYSPMTDGKSIDDWRDIEIETPGPHYQAGIFNRFFYRLSISEGWDIAKTFRLTMKAAQSCFVENTTFEHAAFCLIDAAEEQDKARVSAKLQEVGLIPTNSLVNNLDFSIERLYTSINYALAEPEQAELSALNIRLNEKPLYQWKSNYNTQSQFNAIKRAQLNLESGEHILSIETTNTQGETKTGHRLLSIFADPWCQPETGNILSNQLSVNGEDFVLEQSYTFLAPLNAWYQQSLGEFELHNISADKVLSVFYDLNRDRQFSDDEKVLSTTEYNTAIKLPNVDAVPGDMLVRMRVDDADASACAKNELSQSVDLKVHIEAGTPSTPIDFSHKQVEQTLKLVVTPSYANNTLFRWILPEQIIEQTASELEKAINAQGAYVIALEHVENDKVLSRATKQIELIADPNLVIACEAQNTKCVLSASHNSQNAAVEYKWTLAGEQITKQDNQSFTYDFAGYGEFDVALTMAYIDGTAEFSTNTRVTLEESLPDLSLTVGKQVNSLITLQASSEFDERYSLNWLIGGELQSSHEKNITYEFVSAQMVTLQLLKAGNVVKEVTQMVTPKADLNLEIKCEAQGTQCTFSMSHDAQQANVEYRWVLAGEELTKQDNQSFTYDFAGYGEFDVALTMAYIDGTAEFSAQTKIVLTESLPSLNFVVGKQINSLITLQASSEFDERYSLNWLIGDELQSSHEKNISYEFVSAQMVTLQLLKAGNVVKEVEQLVTPVSEPNLTIQCVVSGTQCELSVEHDLADVDLTYQWSLNGEKISKTSSEAFNYDFTNYGEFKISLILQVFDSNAEFATSTVVQIQEPEPLPEVNFNISQFNNTFTFALKSALPAEFEITIVIDGQEYVLENGQLQIEQQSDASSYVYLLKKAGQIVDQQTHDLQRATVPNLDFKCVADGLSCQFSATHDADTQVAEYVWSIGEVQEPVTTLEPNYVMQFLESGEYSVLLTVVIESGARFTIQKMVTVDEAPYEDVAISFSQHNATLKLETENSDSLSGQYQFVWLLNGEQTTAKQLETELATLATDYVVKLQVLLAGEVVKEVSQTIYVFEDIGLDFAWKSSSDSPLKFAFQSL